MAGLYIHIPFCAKRCLYCDFFSNTDGKYRQPYIRAFFQESELRRAYLEGDPVKTVYFGGGTPSQLPVADLGRMVERLSRDYDLSHCEEWTVEANPDDLTDAYLADLRRLPFDRISLGVQSFREEDLVFLNRRHTAAQAVEAVKKCRDAGWNNLSIDLIYGLPGQTLDDWQRNLDAAVSLPVTHLSAYHLIYEEGTALYRLKNAGRVEPVTEETSVAMFSLLIDRLADAGFIHYEISNFGRPGCFSRHNLSYWTGEKYLGLGPSAHSFNGKSRCWNVASLPAYLRSVAAGKPEVEEEILDLPTRYNEFILTGLRTRWGVDTEVLKTRFGEPFYLYCCRQAARYLESGLLEREGKSVRLTRAGLFVSDGIMSDLLYV